jgi:S-adenosylmethionine:tRNA ribosyltransferase-isomerase
MKTSDFNYELPESLIAQVPLKDRASSKLMVLDKHTGDIEHKSFKDILSYLNPGDTLVLNNTKVIPARIYGTREGHTGKIEVLLLKNTENGKQS